MEKKPIIEFENCTKRFGALTVLDNISFSVKGNSLISVLGKSGSGKTTLIRLLAGLDKLDNGTIHINGEKANEGNKILIPARKRNTGFIFQDLALFPHFTVFQNIAFGLKVNKENNYRAIVDEVLQQFDISGLKDKYPNRLSGGQQQLVALARTWVLKPKILLMDEPMANLDVKLKKQIRLKVRELMKERNVTVFYITHDHREALELSDKILLLNNGKIDFYGNSDDLSKSDSTYVKEFIEI
ncbi:MAG: ABC transporter ATP-binding protein [Chlorobi bacterium]|nr:ABC transporter ATP-binding protein [Chlorobiota bacterium]